MILQLMLIIITIDWSNIIKYAKINARNGMKCKKCTNDDDNYVQVPVFYLLSLNRIKFFLIKTVITSHRELEKEKNFA